MMFFRYENMDYAAYKRIINFDEHVIDVYFVGNMTPILDKNVQEFAENMFLSELEDKGSLV